MRMVDLDTIHLATEAFGDPANPSVLLVMGATASMLGWPDAFCKALADSGHHVIRYDHRDTGQSTTVPPGAADYAVEDLAGDLIGIMDAYGLTRANLVGMSLGGFIAQMVALTHPERVASLTLIASEPLGWDGPPLPHIADAFLEHFGSLATLDWSDPSAVAAFLAASDRLCAGSGTVFDADRAEARAREVLSRTDSPASMFNHGTLTARGTWDGRFRDILCPVLVIHGDEDPILPVENGRAIAAGIAGSSLVVLAQVGHELPLPILPDVVRHIARHIRTASGRAASATTTRGS